MSSKPPSGPSGRPCSLPFMELENEAQRHGTTWERPGTPDQGSVVTISFSTTLSGAPAPTCLEKHTIVATEDGWAVLSQGQSLPEG